MTRWLWLGLALLGLTLGAATPAAAWNRGNVENFATIPNFVPDGGTCPGGSVACTSDVEGVAVGPDGTVYAPSFGFNAAGALTGNGELFVFAPNGHLLRHFPVLGSSAHLIGAAYQQSTKSVLIADLGKGVVWKVDPVAGTSSIFMTAPNAAAAGLNAVAFDRSGNVYVSDSFQGAIWMTGPGGGTSTAWVQNDLLLPTGGTGETLVPPFGANGIEFNNEGTAMFVMNTAYHSIIKIPVNNDGSAGTPATFTTGINAPDGVAVDAHDNLWVLANQGDEVVVVDQTGKVIAKEGDFDGIGHDGSINGLLFPASDAFSPDGRTLYITNLALYLPYAGVPAIAVDSGWTLQVRRYNIARIQVGQCHGGDPCCNASHPC